MNINIVNIDSLNINISFSDNGESLEEINNNNKISKKLDLKIRECIMLLRIHPSTIKSSFDEKDNLNFRCYFKAGNRIFHFVVFRGEFFENTKNIAFYYIVDLKYKKCYKINKENTIDMDTKKPIQLQIKEEKDKDKLLAEKEKIIFEKEERISELKEEVKQLKEKYEKD
jgi:predicted proteasome-type protease